MRTFPCTKYRNAYEEAFRLDSCFGIQIIDQLDRNFNFFLTSCAQTESVNDIEWQHLAAFKQKKNEIIQRKFRRELPPGLDPNIGGKVVDQNPGGKRGGGNEQEEFVRKKLKAEGRIIKLAQPLPGYKMPGDKVYGELFYQKVKKKVQKFNGTEHRLYPRAHSLGFCYADCKNKETHSTLNQATAGELKKCFKILYSGGNL